MNSPVRTLRRSLAASLVLALALAAWPADVLARTQKTLSAPTELKPVRWKDKLLFAPGLYWVDDFDGGVAAGTLGKEYGLPIWNARKGLVLRPASSSETGIVPCGKGYIRFEGAGEVKECTLLREVTMPIEGGATQVTFRAGTRIEFGYDSRVMRGTLARDTALKQESGATTTYKAGTEVQISGAGRVFRTSGAPAAPARPAGGTQPQGTNPFSGTKVQLGK